MAFDISEIKSIRKKLSLTQIQLARLSNVSQSLIAKIEAGTLDPTYSNAQKIFSALESFGNKKEIKAEEIMTTKIVSLSSNETAKDAIKKMKKYEISQMPVVNGDNVVGMISETILLDAILQNKSGNISIIMEDSPPILAKDASIRAISDIMRHYPMVLIKEKGKLKGIITKSDLLRKVYNK